VVAGVGDGAVTRFEQPSRFWEKLGAEHQALLAEHGFEQLKRQQAFRYFTWRWRWGSLRRSRQLRFLLTRSRPGTLARCLVEPARVTGPDWDGVPWSRRDRWLYATATRLLWDYAGRNDALAVLSLPEPELGNPLPVRWRGRLISQDLANSALEATAIARALGGREPGSILEVGAGYGRTAYALLEAFPRATYTVVDIEPALSISRWYLTALFGPDRLRFLRPDEAAAIGSGSADLVVSISSLQEMTPTQVAGYLELFDRVVGDGVVYLKQWRRWTNPDDALTFDLRDHAIPARWDVVFDEPAPVQTNFRQVAWRVPGISHDARGG
jgi:putative sugar O-methyltransferase